MRSAVLIKLLSPLMIVFWGCQENYLFQDDNHGLASSRSSELHSDCKIALIHFNPTLADKEDNIDRLTVLVERAFEEGANVVVTPELATSGYSITKDEVMSGLGMEEPFSELKHIENFAIENNGYVFVGLPEIDGELTYNTYAVFGPNGYETKQRKRGKSEWHEVGNLPYEPLLTPYGDIGFIVCSDEYLPDLARILSIKGADIIVSGANWWGDGVSATQLDIWKTNSHDNDVWQFIANRWGEEDDSRFGYTYTYDMNTAPTAVVNPSGELMFSYKTCDDETPRDTVFYYNVSVPQERIGTNLTNSYSLTNRKPSAYSAIANEFYNPDNGNEIAPNLPNPGILNYMALSYIPSTAIEENLKTIIAQLASCKITPDVIVLPSMGLGVDSFNSSLEDSESVRQFQKVIDDYDISLAVVTIYNSLTNEFGSLLVQKDKTPIFKPQVHNQFGTVGLGESPNYIDLKNSRLGIVTGSDFNFPEVTTSLAKNGVDVILVSSEICGNSRLDNYYWTTSQIESLLKTRSNHGVHIVMADYTGHSFIVRSEWGSVAELLCSNTKSPVSCTLNSSDTRTKYLNRYMATDLGTLIK